MKVIDLLNRIAKGEEVPPIKYYNRNDMQKIVMLTCKENILYRLNDGSIYLNDEVEIIEEPKEIEKIKSNGNEFYSEYVGAWIKKEETDAYCEYLMNKINKLIDVVNELKKENK